MGWAGSLLQVKLSVRDHRQGVQDAKYGEPASYDEPLSSHLLAWKVATGCNYARSFK